MNTLGIGAKIGIAAGVVTMVGGTVGLVIYVLSAGAAWGEASSKINNHDDMLNSAKLEIAVMKEEVGTVKGNQMVVQNDTKAIKEEVQRARTKQEEMSAGQARIEAAVQYLIQQRQAPAASVPVYPQPAPGYPPSGYRQYIPQQAPPSDQWSQQQQQQQQQPYYPPQQQYYPPPTYPSPPR
jgi:FtsZ-interacting cell division protein ZipA